MKLVYLIGIALFAVAIKIKIFAQIQFVYQMFLDLRWEKRCQLWDKNVLKKRNYLQLRAQLRAKFIAALSPK